MRQHRGGRPQPLRAHPEADPARPRRDRHRHGARVQGGQLCRALTAFTALSLSLSSRWATLSCAHSIHSALS